MKKGDITEELIDSIEGHLVRAYEMRRENPDMSRDDQAITSGEMADRVGIADGEASPVTRKAIKMVMRERGLPIVGYSGGYYIPLGPGPIFGAIRSLEGRIEGIQERQELLMDNWESWEKDGNDG